MKKKIGIAIVLCVGVISVMSVCRYKKVQALKELEYSQEYVAGQGNIQGSVDIKSYLALGEDYAIGANEYGYAVFKDPEAAMEALKTDYAQGICLIQEEFELSDLSQNNYDDYGTYGWQVTNGSKEAKEQALFVTNFMDIYENSFEV